MENLVVRSEADRKNLIIMAIAVTAFAALVIFSLYKWFVLGIFQPLELMAEALVLLVLIERMSARYTYAMDKKVIRLTKYGLLGKITHEVPYRDIFGVYRYKPQLISVLKFRRTYRFNSALDRRDVWTLVYTAPGFRGKMENRRFYLKPGDQLLAALRAKLPEKVMPEEQIIKDVLTKAEKQEPR
ncbi:hypothetical protein [Sporomusa acidovorans]|uniref:DUF304 domain-containing protein n=1 Tax=Sporomusa acidovorans (strain ATCC 49682 / DSM 3132 / Mol) TaxID=1123286 RepID=A0ABZ3J0N7_SPOA4|nr:hypothetical protein [Sporomusa acidovorans]OZC22493.1 hypothetical protein SPACI_13310 [Sporomusa acidovorans DSM 3132]SDE73651.1 hypothetical protein SAMN04488499_102048 [Sporomusa acidovorans]